MGVVGVLVVGATAATAAFASSMPAPQVLVVQLHSSCGCALLPATHCATPLAVGNARAELCSAALICAGVSAGLLDSISAMVALTSGVEKLVPVPM